MNVTLPNGQVIQGVPEGTPKDVIRQKAIAAGLATDADFGGVSNGDLGDSVDNVPSVEDSSLLDKGLAIAEPALTVASSAIAEPVAGMAGIAQGINPFADEGASAEAVEGTREFLTYDPKTGAGQAGLETFGEVMEPVGEAISSTEQYFGDTAFDLTGSPEVAALAKSIPTAAMEFIGLKGGGAIGKSSKKVAPSTREIKRAVIDSAPDINQLKDVSRGIYQNLDNAGVRINEKSFGNLFNSILDKTKKQGLDARVTPKAAGALEVMSDTMSVPHTMMVLLCRVSSDTTN